MFETIHEIYILDLIGTGAFAIYGSYLALKNRFGIIGIFICAFLTAVGGGSIREVLLGNIPFYFVDNNYIIVILSGILFSLVIHKFFHRVESWILTLDAVGLVTFAFIGASKADELSLGIFAIVFFATITAVGGGILRDFVLHKVSNIMYQDSYASIAILCGFLYAISGEMMSNLTNVNLLLALCFSLRLTAIYSNLTVWRPWEKFTVISKNIKYLVLSLSKR